jgi:hypothetical protein
MEIKALHGFLGDAGHFLPVDHGQNAKELLHRLAAEEDVGTVRQINLSTPAFSRGSSKEDWLGRQGSNLGMAESKSAALPLGYAP